MNQYSYKKYLKKTKQLDKYDESLIHNTKNQFIGDIRIPLSKLLKQPANRNTSETYVLYNFNQEDDNNNDNNDDANDEQDHSVKQENTLTIQTTYYHTEHVIQNIKTSKAIEEKKVTILNSKIVYKKEQDEYDAENSENELAELSDINEEEDNVEEKQTK